jgi:hypothetical protein
MPVNRTKEKNMRFPQIIENCEPQDITPKEEESLVAAGIIYDSGDGFYHIASHKSWSDVDDLIG